MKAVNLLYEALIHEEKRLPPLPCETVTALCAVTGQRTICLPRKHVIGKAFTDSSAFASPGSQFISVDVFYAWNYGYKTDPKKKMEKKPERMSSWFCDGETWEELNRQGVRTKVFQPNMPPSWAAYATTSYKKHGSIHAKVNSSTSRFWLFETRQVDCSDMSLVNEWWTVLNKALRDGIGRSILETVDCPPYLISKVGFTVWRDFEEWASDKKLSALYAFLCYLLPSQEELKDGYK